MKRIFLFLALAISSHAADIPEPFYDEASVPDYTLPDPLFFENKTPVETPGDWQKRRTEILDLFTTQVYGGVPSATTVTAEVTKTVPDFLTGKAVLREISVYPIAERNDLAFTVLSITPATSEPVAAFLALNFSGNHSIHPSPEISVPTTWMKAFRDDQKIGRVIDNRAQEAGRGYKSRRWPIERIIDAGFGVVTLYYGDIDPDFDDGFENGIHAHFGKPDGPAAWGSIATWAWGLSRVMDYLETDALFDAERIAVMGHSRLGKAALWAGATDERFSLVISNNSGCGGAALSRRRLGERVSRINTSFPHWFCDNFLQYNEAESELPVDQHQLISLVAPRMIYVASAEGDEWADPNGEFLAAKFASPVYELLGEAGIGDVAEQPAVNQPVGDTIRYHVRTGKHDVTDFDWDQYLAALRSSAE